MSLCGEGRIKFFIFYFVHDCNGIYRLIYSSFVVLKDCVVMLE